LFHSSLAELLGIELKKGRQQKFFGIAGAGIDVYFHKVKLKLVGGAESIVIDAGFTESNGVGAILGQSDFFEHYQIKFERYKERLEILPAKKSVP
jgi:hypothetical protein